MFRNPLKYRMPKERCFHALYGSSDDYLHGVHVALDPLIAHFYATSAFETETTKQCEKQFDNAAIQDCYSPEENSPIILEIDTSGYKIIPDIDADLHAETLQDIRWELEKFDSPKDAEEFFRKKEESERHKYKDDDPTHIFYKVMDPPLYPLFSTKREWKAWLKGKIDIPDDVRVKTQRQGRIMEDVPDERICAIRVARPIYDHYVPFNKRTISSLEKETGWLFVKKGQNPEKLTYDDVSYVVYRRQGCNKKNRAWHGTTFVRLKEISPKLAGRIMRSKKFRFMMPPSQVKHLDPLKAI